MAGCEVNTYCDRGARSIHHFVCGRLAAMRSRRKNICDSQMISFKLQRNCACTMPAQVDCVLLCACARITDRWTNGFSHNHQSSEPLVSAVSIPSSLCAIDRFACVTVCVRACVEKHRSYPHSVCVSHPQGSGLPAYHGHRDAHAMAGVR